MLAGCGRQDLEKRIDTTKSEAKVINFNLVEKAVENKINLYQCRKTKTIDGELREQILSFDERVRQSKSLISKEVLLGNPRLGIYQLCLKENKDKENRYLNLDFENKAVTFQGDLNTDKNIEYQAKVKDELSEPFNAIARSLKAIADSSETEEREAC